jgi:hypothetical protein
MTMLMAYAYGRPKLRDVLEPSETPITIELDIPKPSGVTYFNSMSPWDVKMASYTQLRVTMASD